MLEKVSLQTGLPVSKVDKVYHAYWKALKRHIESLPLKEDLSDKEFMELRPNVSIPSIGKLHITLDRYRALKSKYKRLKGEKDVAY